MKLPVYKPQALPEGISAKIDLRQQLKDDKSAVDALSEEIAAQVALVEDALLRQLDEAGTTRGASKSTSVSINESTQFTIADFDALCAYVKKTGYWQLLQRRISVEACREAYAMKKPKDNMGLTPITIRKLNFNKLTK